MSLKDQILYLYNQGKSYTQIIKELKCSRSLISYHVNMSKGENNESINKMRLRHKNWKRDIKLQGIKLKGGKCEKCGYDKCQAALQFHHLDPKKKDLNPSQTRSPALFFKEIEKCILLCANCHFEEHFNSGL